ncbi:hypothetical protein JRQ81_002187 [Phrynocephalus forsythii]|uniref:Uncharacterized protein n=1 Tax=Phrynocephalus forsythii TaxID=171643 RepID=A0A9Q0XID5_9SAUR|nr:hypothetical protein JRQ81_002187 [Phrynocephalus forsythii]
MKDETAVHLYDRERPRSSREKFIQAWNEKLRHQLRPTLSSQVPEPATGIPIQSKETEDEKHPSHLLSRALLGAGENAVYFVKMSDPPPSQLHTVSGDVQAPEPGPRQLPAAASCSDLETSNEEEFREICASDLLPKSPERKKPRLLPQNKNEQQKQASDQPEESPRSPASLGCSHQENTMTMTAPDNPHEVESMPPRSSPKQTPHSLSSGDRPVHPPARCPSPSGDAEASHCPQPTSTSHPEHQHLNQERSSPPSPPVTPTQGALGSLPISCLPPKKQYTREWCL